MTRSTARRTGKKIYFASFAAPLWLDNAKAGIALTDPDGQGQDLAPLFETILSAIPASAYDPEGLLQFLVANLDYSDYVGLIVVGRIINGAMPQGQEVVLTKRGQIAGKVHLSPAGLLTGARGG